MKDSTKHRSTKAISFAYTHEMFFADRHEQLPFAQQYSMFKKHYRESYGREGVIAFHYLETGSGGYAGQLTVYSNEGVILPEFSFGQDFLCKSSVESLIKKTTESNLEISDAVICLPGGGYNIHHFLIEILPSMILFRDEVNRIGEVYLGGFSTSTFITEIMAIFFPKVKVNLILPGTKFHIKQSFILTSFPYKIYPYEIIEAIKKELRSSFAINDLVNENEVLLLSRGDFERNRRMLSNQDQFERILKNQNISFSIHTPAKSDFKTTVRKVTQARTIISQTGGALVHMLWLDSKSRIIELKPDFFMGSSEAYDLARIFNLHYSCVKTRSKDMDWRNASQSINSSEINQVINFILP